MVCIAITSVTGVSDSVEQLLQRGKPLVSDPLTSRIFGALAAMEVIGVVVDQLRIVIVDSSERDAISWREDDEEHKDSDALEGPHNDSRR